MLFLTDNYARISHTRISYPFPSCCGCALFSFNLIFVCNYGGRKREREIESFAGQSWLYLNTRKGRWGRERERDRGGSPWWQCAAFPFLLLLPPAARYGILSWRCLRRERERGNHFINDGRFPANGQGQPLFALCCSTIWPLRSAEEIYMGKRQTPSTYSISAASNADDALQLVRIGSNQSCAIYVKTKRNLMTYLRADAIRQKKTHCGGKWTVAVVRLWISDDF